MVPDTSPPSGDYTVYAWDHRNRLASVTDWDAHGTPANTADDEVVQAVWYGYDAFNQLVRRISSSLSGVENNGFVYDGGQVALEFQRDSDEPLEATDFSHRYL